ncbi:hypothetical protein HYT05_00720 [Candidatus Kaiserbacteria bacterium]|nr:hypothetical protein [Candidatus Kaiserbacteria bacterium]
MSSQGYSIQIQGLADLQRAFKEYPKIAAPRVANAINKALAILQKSATDDVLQFKSPRGLRTGYLQASWGMPGIGLELATPIKLAGRIWSNARYALFVHEGTSPHVITVVRKRVLANKKTGQIFGRRVMHPGSKPNRFLPRIIERGEGEITQSFRQALQNIMGDIAARTNLR